MKIKLYLYCARELIISKNPEMNYLVQKQCIFMEDPVDEGYERNIRHDLSDQNPIQEIVSRI